MKPIKIERGQPADAGALKGGTGMSAKVIVVARTEIAFLDIMAALAPIHGIKVERAPNYGVPSPALLADHDTPTLVLLDVETGSPQEVALVRELKSAASSNDRVSVIVVTSRANAEVPLRVMRAGADDVLFKPMDAEEVKDIFARFAERPRPSRTTPASLGKIVVFMHLSGGAGATTLAVNSGSALARAAKNHDACLLDLDVQFGNAANLLDLPSTSPIQEFIDDPARLDAQMLESMMLRHATGLHVLSAPRTLLPIGVYGASAVKGLLELARRRYEFVVVDLPVALAPWTDTVLELASVVYLVTPLTVPAAHRLNKFIELLRQEGVTRLPLKIVANRHHTGFRGNNDVTVAQFEKATATHVDFMIPNDYSLISMSHGQGKPAVGLKPNSPFTSSLKQMLAADLGQELFARSGGGLFSFRKA